MAFDAVVLVDAGHDHYFQYRASLKLLWQSDDCAPYLHRRTIVHGLYLGKLARMVE